MVIQHNMQAMNTNRQLGISVGAGAKSTEKLSSGYRINRAGDDAAGLAISEKMRSQIRGLDRASANSQDGISLIQTAEGALNETQSILQRMRELAVQAANGTNTDSDRNEIQKEVNQLTSEINRIANTTEFNTMKLLKGNTNKAEIGGVDTETLKNGETGVAGGSLENFKVEQTSTQAKDSSAKLIGNTAEATGSLKGDILEEKVKGIQGEYSTTTVGGITFSSTEKSASGNGKEIIIKSISDTTAAGTVNQEGIVKAGNKIYIALTESTISSVANAQELINRINNLGSGTTTAASGSTASALGIAGTAGITGTTIAKQDLELTLPKDEPTGNSVQAFLPQSAGKEVTGTLQGGKAEVQGEYTLEIDKLFKEADDTITIAGEKFTSKNSGADTPSAGDFSLGDSHAIVSFQLKGVASGTGKINLKIGNSDFETNIVAGEDASTILEKLKTKAEGIGASVLYDKDNGYITIVSKELGASGNFATALSIDASVGSTMAMSGQVTISGVVASGNEKEAQNANLAAAIALNANIGKNYVLGANPGNGAITIKEKINQGGVGKELDRTLKVEGSGGEDNTITITNPKGMNGIEFEIKQYSGTTAQLSGVTNTGAVPGGITANVQITQSAVGSNKFYINLGTTTNGNTAAKIQQALRDFVKAGTVKLENGSVADFSDLTVETGGKWDDETTNVSNITKDWTATAGGVEEKAGTYSFDVTSLFKDGDQVNIAGKTFIAKSKDADLNKGEFDISSTDKATQALRLKEAIGANAELAEKYDIKVNNNKITLIEKSASGKDMEETDVKVENLGTQGQFKVDELELQKDGASITIDGQKIDFSSKNAHVGYENGTAIKVTDTVEDQKIALTAAINKNAELSKKYEASISEEDGSLILTQKVGSEEEPEITTTSSTKGTFDVTFQVGANTGQSMTIAIGDNRANALGVAGDGTEESIMAENGATAYYTKVSNVTDGTTNDNIEFALDVTSFEKATAAIGVIDDALSSISAQRSQLGAYQNRLEHTIANLDNTSENLQASESRIRDVDMAKEMTNFSKNNILQQAAQSMLAQANQSTQGVLTLLR